MSALKAAPPNRPRVTALLVASSLVLLLAACARNVADTAPRRMNQTWSPRVVQEGRAVPRGGGTYKIGSPYQVKGQWFTPREEPGYDQQGIASWYGADFHGRKTANGEIYDMNALTAAHPTLPIPSYAYVTNLETGRTLLVRINDRGPYVADRVIDLSRQSATLLGYRDRGTARVRVRYAGPAPLNGDERREQQYLAAQPWHRSGYAQNGYAPSSPVQSGNTDNASVYRPPYLSSPAAAGRPRAAPWGLGMPSSRDVDHPSPPTMANDEETPSSAGQ